MRERRQHVYCFVLGRQRDGASPTSVERRNLEDKRTTACCAAWQLSLGCQLIGSDEKFCTASWIRARQPRSAKQQSISVASQLIAQAGQEQAGLRGTQNSESHPATTASCERRGGGAAGLPRLVQAENQTHPNHRSEEDKKEKRCRSSFLLKAKG